MPDRTGSPGWTLGALVGALLTAPLIVVLYLGRQLAGLPFVPFDVFDWTARTLPGSLVTFGIDAMVAAIRALGVSDLSSAAKAAEQTLAVLGLLVTGVVAGAALFLVLRRWGSGRAVAAGFAVGALVGVPALLISLAINRTASAGPWASALWTLAAFLTWGAALGWCHDRLSGRAPAAAAGSGSEGGTGPSGARRLADSGLPAASAHPLDRRRFLVRVGGASAVITVAGAAVATWLASVRERERLAERGAAWSETHPLPNSDAEVDPVPGTRPELTPVRDHYRIDINSRPPEVDEADWRLRVGGLVERPGEWTLDDLRTRWEPLDQFVTLSCISNPIAGSLIGTQRWTGVPLRRILDEAGLRPSATHLAIRSADGFHEVVPVESVLADERVMLTYAWDGLSLPVRHGFPIRIYRPDRYGMKQPKWIESIDAIDHEEQGYWVRRGWDAEARMNATSVIDTVGVDMMVAEADAGTRIPVGGIAHAGARGVAGVEVRVDDGEWQEAELREPLSDTTWVLWRFEWPFREGEHTFTVRCREGDGTPQVAERSPVRPAGATGLHSDDVML